MSFQIAALNAEEFNYLGELSASELAARNIHKKTVDSHPGFPCRVSLEDANVGETVYLLNYGHHQQDTPYRSTHAIFVRPGVSTAHPAPGEIPAAISSRLLSVRAFNAVHDMVIADVVEGYDLVFTINAFFDDEAIAYLHIHNARPGCYAARVDRI